MKLYTVALLFTKPISGGVNNLISAKILWANSEEEAFGIVYDVAEEKYKDQGYSLLLRSGYEVTSELINEHLNEQHSDNCETDKCQGSCKCG